jgi:hypothetical protein
MPQPSSAERSPANKIERLEQNPQLNRPATLVAGLFVVKSAGASPTRSSTMPVATLFVRRTKGALIPLFMLGSFQFPALRSSPVPGSTSWRLEQNKNNGAAMDRHRPIQRPVAIRALGDLGECDHMYAYCNRCRHSSQLDLEALRERYGNVTLKRLRARLRCSRCGARSVEMFHVWGAGPHGRP